MIVAAAAVVGLLAPIHVPAMTAEYVPPSPWAELAECESGGDWTEGDGGLGPFRGGLQFHPDTWAAFRDDDMPADPAAATPRQQVTVAERVLDAQGWGAWPVCSRKLGLEEEQ